MTLYGIDVSSWQPADITARVEYDFAIIKATGGTGYVSAHCDEQVQHARRRGKLYGLYHFAGDGFVDEGPKKEADFFVDNIQGYLKDHPILVLDWEADAVHRGVDWALAWLRRVYERTGVRPVFYTYAHQAQKRENLKIAAENYGLWIASYGDGSRNTYGDAPGEPPASPWPFSIMFQYTSSGRLAGYDGRLDLNVFYGSEDTWWNYAAPTGKNPVPAPVEKPPASAAQRSYTVQRGDTLSGIAARYGTTWQQLQKNNGIKNPDLIFPGQVLKL